MADGGLLARRLKQLDTGDWLGTAIDRAPSGEPERWTAPNPEIHPSGAGSPCIRDIQLSMLGHHTEIKPKNRRRMDNGTAAHARWTAELDKAGVLVKGGERLKIPGYWSGEYDVMVRNPVTGKTHLGEIKTMNDGRFRRVPAQERDYLAMASVMYKAESSYVFQLTQYLVEFRRLYPELSDDVFFLFENTNDQDYCIRWFRPNEKLMTMAFTNSLAAREATLAGQLIDPPFKRGSITCRKCYREQACYNLQDGLGVGPKAVSEALMTKWDETVFTADNEGREVYVAEDELGDVDELVEF